MSLGGRPRRQSALHLKGTDGQQDISVHAELERVTEMLCV